LGLIETFLQQAAERLVAQSQGISCMSLVSSVVAVAVHLCFDCHWLEMVAYCPLLADLTLHSEMYWVVVRHGYEVAGCHPAIANYPAQQPETRKHS
jgi:uncharacterized protein (DUF486 family)